MSFTLLTIGLPVLAFFTLAGVFYNWIILPILLDRSQFKLTAAKDQLRAWSVLCGADPNDSTYQFVATKLETYDRCLPWLSFQGMLDLVDDYSKDQIEDYLGRFRKFSKEAGPELKRIHDQGFEALALGIAARSPVWMAILFIMGGVLVMSYKALIQTRLQLAVLAIPSGPEAAHA